MRVSPFIPTLLLLLSSAAMAQQKGPERTIGTAPPQSQTGGGLKVTGMTEAQIRSAVETYRRSWARMNERSRRMMLSNGGKTPEQYEQMLRQGIGGGHLPAALFAEESPNAVAPSGGEQPASAPSAASSSRDMNLDVLHTMKTSTQDLNTIRDANLQRVQKGGCAPELASRIADLKGRLEVQEGILRADSAATAAVPEPVVKRSARPPGSPAALAADWYNGTGQTSATASSTANRQLDAVLGTTSTERPAAATSVSAEQKRKQAEAEIVQIKAELDRLASACAPAVRR